MGEVIMALEESACIVSAGARSLVGVPIGPRRAVRPGGGPSVVVEERCFVSGIVVRDNRERHLSARRLDRLLEWAARDLKKTSC